MILPQTNQFLPSSLSLSPLPLLPSPSLHYELSGYAGYFPTLTTILSFFLSCGGRFIVFFFFFFFLILLCSLFLFFDSTLFSFSFFCHNIFFFPFCLSSSFGDAGLFCASRPIWMSLRSWLVLCRQVSLEDLKSSGGCGWFVWWWWLSTDWPFSPSFADGPTRANAEQQLLQAAEVDFVCLLS